MISFSRHFLDHAAKVCGLIDAERIDWVAAGIAAVRDAGGWLFVLIGGSAGNAGRPVNDYAERSNSMNLMHALRVAQERGTRVFGVVGRDGGDTGRVGDEVVIVPTTGPALVTPLSESDQAVVWHCLVSHAALKKKATK